MSSRDRSSSHSFYRNGGGLSLHSFSYLSLYGSKWYLSDVDGLVRRAQLKDSRSLLLQKLSVSLGSCSQLGSASFLSEKAGADLKTSMTVFERLRK